MPDFSPTCPIPINRYPKVTLAHGGGGKLMNQLIQEMFVPAFNNDRLEARHDGAVFSLNGARLAFSTDSYVVKPLFFPGGDIGSLAIHGTVNDLAMCGARPVYLSCGLIIEEGFDMESLWRVVQSMQQAVESTGVELVTGDTKVVDNGKGDGVYINTAGIGVIEHDLAISPASVRPGDAIVLSGDIGRHGIAIMAQREGLAFESKIESDSAPVADLVMALIAAGIQIHCLRDLTRGGLASALIEIAETAGMEVEIKESAIPVLESVRGACEILGLDPLYVANEGRFIALVPEEDVERTLNEMRGNPLGNGATVIGRVEEGRAGLVKMENQIGTKRIIDMLSGEQLPRIC